MTGRTHLTRLGAMLLLMALPPLLSRGAQADPPPTPTPHWRSIPLRHIHAAELMVVMHWDNAVPTDPLAGFVLPSITGDVYRLPEGVSAIEASSDSITLLVDADDLGLKEVQQIVAALDTDSTADRPDHSLTQFAHSRQSHNVYLEQAQREAEAIKLGASRAEVGKVFSQQDGGLMTSSLTRYYLGDGLMVDVPFDENGGAWSPSNRVSEPLRVYESPLHCD